MFVRLFSTRKRIIHFRIGTIVPILNHQHSHLRLTVYRNHLNFNQEIIIHVFNQIDIPLHIILIILIELEHNNIHQTIPISIDDNSRPQTLSFHLIQPFLLIYNKILQSSTILKIMNLDMKLRLVQISSFGVFE
jgi:hypothetical protein